jgi:hypothetical protein
MSFDQTFPPLLAAANEIEIDYEGDGIDFEPYDEFQPPEENASWIRAWTGNEELTGSEYRIFGQDGTGGLVALWVTRSGADLLDQPVVFFGSEGEIGIVAYDFGDYLWLLAGGVGPMEAVEHGADGAKPNAAFTALATKHAPGAKKTPSEVLARAREAYPSFSDDFMAQCRH